MIEPVITQLPKSRVQIAFLVLPEEAQPFLEQAAADISASRPIKGFRPGKASYEEVRRAYGEMPIWESALERIIRAKYVKTILDHHLDTVGSPELSVEQLVPGQEIKFTATASLMPTVTRLMEYSKPLVTKKIRTVTNDEVEKVILELRTMRRTEAAADKAAEKSDAVVIDLEIRKDGVPVEGGTSRGYKVYLNESHYLPGFAEKLLGVKKGDVRTFELEFPKDHYTKMLAGATAEFTATVTDVYELRLPDLDDAFAKTLGQDSVALLRELLLKNLQEEQDRKSDEAAEIELLETLVKGSTFSEIPELLVNEEVRRMVAELEHGAEERGMKMADYLSSLKKTADQLKLDLVPRALERVQTSVLIKEVGKRENVQIADADVEAEQDRILDSLPKDDAASRERVASPEYRDYIALQMRNRKVLEALKAKGIS